METPSPDWTSVGEGDVLITNMRDGNGMLATKVLNGKLYAIHWPSEHPDWDHPAPVGRKEDATIPLACGLWRKIYDAKTGWRRD